MACILDFARKLTPRVCTPTPLVGQVWVLVLDASFPALRIIGSHAFYAAGRFAPAVGSPSAEFSRRWPPSGDGTEFFPSTAAHFAAIRLR